MFEQVYAYLTEAGDGTGAREHNGNYSVTPRTIKYTAPAGGGKVQLHRMVVSYTDAPGMTVGEYGNLGAALTNGVRFAVYRKGVLAHNFGDTHIHSNGEWGEICYDVDIKTWGTTPSDDVVLIRWTFAKAGEPIRLHPGDEFRVILNDDFSGLTSHSFMVQGINEAVTV